MTSHNEMQTSKYHADQTHTGESQYSVAFCVFKYRPIVCPDMVDMVFIGVMVMDMNMDMVDMVAMVMDTDMDMDICTTTMMVSWEDIRPTLSGHVKTMHTAMDVSMAIWWTWSWWLRTWSIWTWRPWTQAWRFQAWPRRIWTWPETWRL